MRSSHDLDDSAGQFGNGHTGFTLRHACLFSSFADPTIHTVTVTVIGYQEHITEVTEKKISSHAHKTGSCYLLGVLFKISDQPPPPSYLNESPPGVSACLSVTL